LCDVTNLTGESLPVCPRSRLRDVVGQLGDRGFDARAAFEIEGMLFADSEGAARAKHYRGLTPLSLPTPLGYLHLNSRAQLAVIDDALARMEALGIAVEGWHDEAAPGQFEINLDPADPLTACDNVVRAKQVLKQVAFEHGHVATFAAKPSDAYGSGLHVHHSLGRDGEPVFYAPDGTISATTRQWIGGLMATMPAATSVLCPTINSYRRMVGFAAAPTVASWAEDNKSTALRVLSRAPGSARIEHRVASADANPYLVLATVLAGGIVGIDKAIEPPDALAVAGWGLPEGYPHLPNTITKSADALAGDTLLRSVLGDAFCTTWVNTRRWEWLMYHTTGGDPTATTVTQWELDRYFEVV
jgi:glutamine synthetase